MFYVIDAESARRLLTITTVLWISQTTEDGYAFMYSRIEAAAVPGILIKACDNHDQLLETVKASAANYRSVFIEGSKKGSETAILIGLEQYSDSSVDQFIGSITGTPQEALAA